MFSCVVFLLGSGPGSENQKQFTQFNIYARGASNVDRSKARLTPMNPRRTGRYQLFDDALTEFNIDCVNTVSQADDIEKSEIQVMWVAPASGSGCVALSAMVYENSKSWFADDSRLTKILCEEKPMNENTNEECCACDEAKYQVSNNHNNITLKTEL